MYFTCNKQHRLLHNDLHVADYQELWVDIHSSKLRNNVTMSGYNMVHTVLNCNDDCGWLYCAASIEIKCCMKNHAVEVCE